MNWNCQRHALVRSETMTSSLHLLRQFFKPLLGPTRSRGRCWAAIRSSHCPEPSGRAIGVGASKFLLVRTSFAKIPPNVSEKLRRKWPQKNDCISFRVGRIFSDQSTSRTIFAQISPKLALISRNLPEKNWITTWPPKKRLHFNFGCHVCKITHCTPASYTGGPCSPWGCRWIAHWKTAYSTVCSSAGHA